MIMAEQLMTTLHNGVKMPLLGLGVYDMYHAEAEAAVSTALATGYRLIDTASLYRNEKEVGNAVRNSGIPRSDIFITTKVGNTDQGYDQTLRAFETSQKLLNIEYIDAYLVHWPIRATRRETWLALERLYQEKRVRVIGVANYLLPFLKELEGYASMAPLINQVEFSPYCFLKDLLATCRSHGIQLQSYTPLIRGKKFSDPRLIQIADAYGKTPAQVILRWNLQHGVSTIPKSAHPERLKENFEVFDFHLSETHMAQLDLFHENFRIVDDPMEYW